MSATATLLDAPKDNLIRMVVRAPELRQEDGDEGRTLVGYASVFNAPAEIWSWEGRFLETFLPGAFKRTLRNNGDKIKVLFNHGFDPSIGDKPLGKPAVMREDDAGLWVEVPFSRTSYNEDLLALVRDGAIDGMSITFSIVKDSWEYPEDELPRRTIKEVKLYEFGPVTWPAYEATTTGIRNREDFKLWQGLNQDQRNQIKEMSRTSMATPSSDPADEPALNPDDPQSHSSVRTALIRAVIAHELKRRQLVA